jgi:hypothetical protein
VKIVKVKPTKGDFELPSEDNHRAAIVALVDLGTHVETFKGVSKEQRKVLIAFELLDEEQSNGKPFVMGLSYSLSLYEKASLRKVYEAAVRKIEGDGEVDLEEILGKPVMLSISHTTPNADGKRYAKIEAITRAGRAERGSVQETTCKPYLLSLDSPPDVIALPEWLPWVYGVKAQDLITSSPEYEALPLATRRSAGPRPTPKNGPASGETRTGPAPDADEEDDDELAF